MTLILLKAPRWPLETRIKVDPSFFRLVASMNAVSYSIIRSTGDDVDDSDAILSLCVEDCGVSSVGSSAISSIDAPRNPDARAATADLAGSPRHVPWTKRSWALSF